MYDLKKRLAKFVRLASRGERILITRHHQQVAALVPADAEHLRIGVRAGHGSLTAGLKGARSKRYLELLLEDRANR
jgi:prevent-host-death family protein